MSHPGSTIRFCMTLGFALLAISLPATGQDKPATQEAKKVEPEPEPTSTDVKARVTARIARWHENKTAAVSLRFDDSHPSHIEIAVPMLTRYGMVGTFFINPGSDSYQKYKERWETEAIHGGHEFANHTMHLIQAPNSASVGVDPEKCQIADLDAFKARTEKTIEEKGWISFYWHAIGVEKGMGISRKEFADQIGYLRTRRKELWFGGIAAIYKYREERKKAKIAVKEVEPFKLKIDVTCETDPALYDQPLTAAVELPPKWPLNDIQALDAAGKPFPMTRHTEKWNVPMLNVPPVNGTYSIHVVDPLQGRKPPKLPDEAERTVKDENTGIGATICRWLDGRKAALSIRFDDSHPTHILKAVPILREYGFKGTFIICPGGGAYQKHKTEWEACAKQGDQEFGNHTMTHTGARSDEECEYEIGECSRIIWGLFPNKSKLLTFSTGGGTTWTHTKPLRYWLDKYHLDTMYGALSMADSYGDRIEAFKKRLAAVLEKGEWLRTVYHQIGSSTGLGISEENFRAVHDIAKEHERKGDLWVGGMAEIFKYQQERKASRLSIRSLGDKKAEIGLSCTADRELYDQPLTLQLTLPDGWKADSIKVTGADGNEIRTRSAAIDGRTAVRFEITSVDGKIVVSIG